MAPAAYITSRPASSSLLSALTCIPQPSLTPYHRLFGRVVIGPLLLGHASLYLSFFAQSAHPEYPSLLAKRINDPDVQWGFGALTMAVSVLLFARPSGPGAWRFRGTGTLRSDRQVFYVVHLLLIGCFCSAAYCHVAQARTFVVQGLTGFVVNVGCSWILMGKRDSR